jgi:hypothetical protein
MGWPDIVRRDGLMKYRLSKRAYEAGFHQPLCSPRQRPPSKSLLLFQTTAIVRRSSLDLVFMSGSAQAVGCEERKLKPEKLKAKTGKRKFLRQARRQ